MTRDSWLRDVQIMSQQVDVIWPVRQGIQNLNTFRVGQCLAHIGMQVGQVVIGGSYHRNSSLSAWMKTAVSGQFIQQQRQFALSCYIMHPFAISCNSNIILPPKIMIFVTWIYDITHVKIHCARAQNSTSRAQRGQAAISSSAKRCRQSFCRAHSDCLDHSAPTRHISLRPSHRGLCSCYSW